MQFKFWKHLAIGLSLTVGMSAAHAEKVTVAAAADLKYAMADVVQTFEKAHPNDKIDVIYGSSGKFFTQIQQGAPYDLFYSADIQYPRDLEKAGQAGGKVAPYAVGRIVLWSPVMDASKMTLESLTNPGIKHIAIANPKHAPYGKRAEEALKAANVWDKVEPKLVYGENISHTAQLVDSGNAQVGILALSLVLTPQMQSKGKYWLIPDNLHDPLEQGYVLTKRGENNAAAKAFAAYMDSPEARAVMTRYGFVLPSSAK
ncbi:MAG: molybdate ABC transporter substrate-binding protein [Burkholderiaceae bacterium]|nr:molybdate ABC transporter substrate-binding protein [Burkholderiaceae bacterium]